MENKVWVVIADIFYEAGCLSSGEIQPGESVPVAPGPVTSPFTSDGNANNREGDQK